MSVVTVPDSTPTAIASLELSRAEEKDSAPKLSKPVETARGRAVEITLRLAPDEDGVLKLLSATELQENARSSPLREIALKAPSKEEAPAPIAKTMAGGWRFYISPLLLLAALIVGFAVRAQYGQVSPGATLPQGKVPTKKLADRIIIGESQGDSAAKNPHSTAAGLAQFVEGTWLDLVKRHRPDIAARLKEKQILALREDPQLSRFMTGRYIEQNISILSKRGLPTTPGSLYLAHFAGPDGAAAILAAPESADAATVIANADRRPGVTREKILSGNPFLKNFT